MNTSLEGNGIASPLVRVLIADGAELVRRGIRDVLLQCDRSFAVVGEVARAEDLIEACAMALPDVLVLSLGLDESMRPLRAALVARPSLRVLVLLEEGSGEWALQAVRAGARGLLPREASAETLLAAVREVAGGGTVLDPQLAAGLFEFLTQRGNNGVTEEAQLDPAVLARLSVREREVMRLLAQGYRNKEIGRQLGVSLGTVKTHLRHIFRKLDVIDRTEAAVVALRGRTAKAA